MRRLVSALAGLGFVVAAAGCNADNPVTGGSVTILTKLAQAPGDSLQVDWVVVSGTDGYLLWDDSQNKGTLEVIDTIVGEGNSIYTFSNNCTKVGVSTYVGANAGDPSFFSLPLVKRTGLVILSKDSTTAGTDAYFKITLDSAEVMLYDSASRNQSYGFVAGPADTLTINTSYPLYEDKASVLLYRDTTSASLDAMTLAPDPSDAGWQNANVALAPGDRFYVYVDEALLGALGWTNLDLFGKMEVTAVNGSAVTIELRAQTSIQALRWMTE